MLFALLYNAFDQIVAAAPACDLYSGGARFWTEIHAAAVQVDGSFQTAIVRIDRPELASLLLQVGIDDSIDLQAITKAVETGGDVLPVKHAA